MNERVKQHKEDRGKEAPSREELLASYRYLASILESMLDPVIVTDPDGTIRTVNSATLGLLGYTEEEILGRPVGTIFEEDFFRGTGLARLVCEGVVRDVEVTLRAKSGERIPVVFNGSVIREKDGRLIAVVGVARDMREQLRAEKALERRATQLQTLSEVGREITSLLELDPLLDRIVKLIHEAFNYRYVTIFLVDRATGELVLQAGTGYEVGPTKAVRLKAGEEGICGWVASSGEPLLVNDVSQEARYYPVEVLTKTRAELGVPIRAKGEVIGVLDVQSPELGVFDEDDLFTLQALADQVGIAIENVRLYQQLQEAVARTTRLYELSVELGEGLGLEETLNLVAQKVVAATGAHSAVINLLDEEGNLKLRVGMGAEGKRLEDEPLPRPAGTTASICRTGKPLIVSGLGKEVSLIFPHLRKKGIKAFIGLPLKTKERSIGVLFVRYGTPHPFPEDEVRALSLFASQAAVAIENARLFEMERQRSAQLAAVSEVAKRIAAILNLDELLQETVELITQTFGYYYAAIMLVDTETDDLVFKVGVGGYSGMTPVGYRQKMREGMIGWSAYLGETLWANDVSQEPRYIPAYLPETKSELDVPLKHRGKVIGVLDLQSKEFNAFSQHDVIAMETLAGQIAIAIENARLYQEITGTKDYLQSVLNSSIDLIFTVKPDGTFGYFNPRLAEITGYESDDVRGRLFLDFIPEGRRAFMLKKWEEISQGISGTYETEIIGADDRRIPVLVSQSVIEGFNEYLVILRDISDIKAAEQEILHRAERLASINRLSATVSSSLDLNKVLDITIKEIVKLFGVEHAGVMIFDQKREWGAVQAEYPDWGATAERFKVKGYLAAERIITEQKPLMIEDVLEDPLMAEVRDAMHRLGIKSMLIVPLVVKGETIGSIGLDAKEHRIFTQEEIELAQTIANQAAVAIEKARLFGETERLRAFNESIVEGVAEAILIENMEGIITFANPAAEELSGYTREELIGFHWSALIPEDQIEKVKREATKRPQGIKNRYEAALLRKDKARIPVIVSARPLFEGGKLAGVLSALTDITERVQAEEALRGRFINLAEMISRVFGLRDPYVAAHQDGTAQLTRVVGAKMGLDEQKLQALYIGSLLHDIGKAAIPEGILRKPGKLAEEEWGLVRTHPQRGYEVLKNTNLPWPVAELALHHHERLDGSGYPDGLKGDELCLEVRILAVCNVVDAMSARRPWRPAHTKQEIVEELKRGKGIKYDPPVVEVILEMIESGELELPE